MRVKPSGRIMFLLLLHVLPDQLGILQNAVPLFNIHHYSILTTSGIAVGHRASVTELRFKYDGINLERWDIGQPVVSELANPLLFHQVLLDES
jgi:hypothetical protein